MWVRRYGGISEVAATTERIRRKHTRTQIICRYFFKYCNYYNSNEISHAIHAIPFPDCFNSNLTSCRAEFLAGDDGVILRMRWGKWVMVVPNHSTCVITKEDSVDIGLSLTGWTADGNMHNAEYPDRCRGG